MSEAARLAGSVLCTGFPGDTPDAEVLEALAELAPAGVVLFSRNVSTPEGTRRLVAAIRNAVGESTFVAVDQEGGRVARLRAGFTPLPSAMAVGACGDPELAERLGAAIACDLRRIEADVNFAPVLDLALEPANTVIGTRSFGDDAQRVAALGAAVVRGLEGEGVAATLKHFPGLGASARDPHRELPRIDVALATLRARELVPFQAGFAAGARAAMSAHALVPAFDRAQPATLSARILGDVLRGELGFEGAVFTDALEMQAIAGGAGSARGAVLAVAAGADCVLFGEGPAAAQAARDALVDALERGELSDARLRDAAARVARLRSRVKAGGERDAPDGEISRATAQRAIAALRGSDRLERAHPVTVVSFEGGSFDGAGEPAGAQASLSLALRRRNLRSELMRVPLEPSADMRNQLVELVAAQRHQLVIVMRRAHLHPAQGETIDALLGVAPNAIAVSALEPFDALRARTARTILCSFGDDELAFEAVADVLVGRFEATGTVPVSLERAPA